MLEVLSPAMQSFYMSMFSVDPHLRNGALADKVLQEYGSNIHEAAQGPHARVRYLQELADVLFPYILPPTALKCKCV